MQYFSRSQLPVGVRDAAGRATAVRMWYKAVTRGYACSAHTCMQSVDDLAEIAMVVDNVLLARG